MCSVLMKRTDVLRKVPEITGKFRKSPMGAARSSPTTTTKVLCFRTYFDAIINRIDWRGRRVREKRAQMMTVCRFRTVSRDELLWYCRNIIMRSPINHFPVSIYSRTKFILLLNKRKRMRLVKCRMTATNYGIHMPMVFGEGWNILK